MKSNYLGAKVELEFYDKEVKCSIHKNNDRVESAFGLSLLFLLMKDLIRLNMLIFIFIVTEAAIAG